MSVTTAVTTADITTHGYRCVRTAFCMTLTGEDQYGSATAWLFSIATLLYHHDPDMIPASWQYRHTVVCGGEDLSDFPPEAEDSTYELDMLLEILEVGSADISDILAFGLVLGRYAGYLRITGKEDY